MTEKLSQKDVELLTKSKDVESKIAVINKISGQYRDKAFTGKEQGLAEEIFRLLLRYAEIGVRKSIAENLMSADFVPRDVLLSLAKDIDDVSRPILEFSELLTDDDLVDIINTANSTESQIAISRRNSLSESVSAALVNTEKGEVVTSLMENTTANIPESSLVKVIDSFSNKEEVVEALVTRGSIPPKLVVELTKKVSSVIRSKLEKKYNCSLDKISNLFSEGGEIAAFRFGNMKLFGNDLLELVNMLETNGQLEQALDPLHGKLTFILNDLEPIGQFVPISAVALGNKTMFEICMCRIAGVKYSNVAKLVADLDTGLKALYEKAALPEPLFETIRFALHVIHNMDDQAKKFGTQRARDNLHEYIKQLINQSKGRKIRNLSSFISIVRKHVERSQGEW